MTIRVSENRSHGRAQTSVLPIRLPVRGSRARTLIENYEAALDRRHVGTSYTTPQERLQPLRDPDLTVFRGDEVKIILDVIKQLKGKRGHDVSDLSHQFHCWRAARENEKIDFRSTFVSPRELYPDEVEYGEELAARLN